MSAHKDPDSWRGRSVARRDFRATHGEPEVPRQRSTTTRRQRSTTPAVRCAKSPTGEHIAERYVAERTNLPGMVAIGESTYDVEISHLDVRCAICRADTLAPRLLAPVADVIGDRQLSALLAGHWCTDGHLYDTTQDVDWGATYRHRKQATRTVRYCVMCGRTSSPYHSLVRDVVCATPTGTQLLLGAGVPPEVAKRVGLSPLRTNTIYRKRD
jgi:hypothetical protein